jgi:hypothetical protein
MPERIEREAGDKVFEDYNLWYDCSPKPESGDVAPFLAYAEHTIPDAFLRDTLFMLFAHRIQKPQDISPIMVYLMGREGTGKSTIFSCLFRAVTLNEEYIHQGQLELSYTHESNHINKQCVEAEDPKKSGMTNTDIESMFKTLGSNDNLTYNPKGIQAYQVKNRGVLCISSNAHYLPASGDARRWLMIESPNGQNEQLSGACYNWMATCPNWQGKLRKYLIERFPDVDPREIIKRSAASGIKQEILNENRHPHLAMFEEMIAELEEELRDLKFIPSRLMSDRHPFSEMDHGQKSNLGRVLSTEYPLATIGSGTTFSVRINGKPHNTTLRSLIKHNKVIMENEQAADIYRAWYNHPSTGRKY